MPTYDYECLKCKKGFEAFQSMKDDAFTTCPKEKCQMKSWGKGKVKRLIGTGAGLIFKGSGFYITDYRSEGYKSAAKSDSAASATSPKSESGKADAKPKVEKKTPPKKD
jgi:putative FmdB family regulatory protein